MRGLIVTAAWLVCLVGGPPATAQTTSYAQVGNWAITRSDGNQCWMATGTSTSVFALTLDNRGRYGVAFSVIREAAVPAQILFGISAMDVPFSKDKDGMRKAFTKVFTRGTEHFYQARLTAAEMAVLRRRRIISFTEMLTGAGGYSNISAAHVVDYDSAAEQVWRRCVAELGS